MGARLTQKQLDDLRASVAGTNNHTIIVLLDHIADFQKDYNDLKKNYDDLVEETETPIMEHLLEELSENMVSMCCSNCGRHNEHCPHKDDDPHPIYCSAYIEKGHYCERPTSG